MDWNDKECFVCLYEFPCTWSAKSFSFKLIARFLNLFLPTVYKNKMWLAHYHSHSLQECLLVCAALLHSSTPHSHSPAPSSSKSLLSAITDKLFFSEVTFCLHMHALNLHIPRYVEFSTPKTSHKCPCGHPLLVHDSKPISPINKFLSWWPLLKTGKKFSLPKIGALQGVRTVSQPIYAREVKKWTTQCQPRSF